MRALSASELLGVWERGVPRLPTDRALELLAAAFPETSRDALAKLSIGQRNRRLLDLRESIFGTRFSGLASCSGCREQVELDFAARDIRPPEAQPQRPPDEISPPNHGAAMKDEVSVELLFAVDDYQFAMRLPNSEDIAALENHEDIAAARQLLLRRCMIHGSHGVAAVAVEQLSANVILEVGRRLADADPHADTGLNITCPHCGVTWRELFDVSSYLWAEVQAWAVRILREVHLLAQAYGWREADILAMSPWRRQAYLEMVVA